MAEPFEVGDVGDAEAVDLLVSRRFHKDVATELVRDVTGGRFKLLSDYWDNPGVSVAAVRVKHFKKTEKVVKRLGLSTSHPLFKYFVAQGSITTSAAIDFLDADKIDALLKKNILSEHPDETYTFHSRHHVTLFQARDEEARKAEEARVEAARVEAARVEAARVEAARKKSWF
jgi:hypothetical protein